MSSSKSDSTENKQSNTSSTTEGNFKTDYSTQNKLEGCRQSLKHLVRNCRSLSLKRYAWNLLKGFLFISSHRSSFKLFCLHLTGRPFSSRILFPKSTQWVTTGNLNVLQDLCISKAKGRRSKSICNPFHVIDQASLSKLNIFRFKRKHQEWDGFGWISRTLKIFLSTPQWISICFNLEIYLISSEILVNKLFRNEKVLMVLAVQE